TDNKGSRRPQKNPDAHLNHDDTTCSSLIASAMMRLMRGTLPASASGFPPLPLRFIAGREYVERAPFRSAIQTSRSSPPKVTLSIACWSAMALHAPPRIASIWRRKETSNSSAATARCWHWAGVGLGLDACFNVVSYLK